MCVQCWKASVFLLAWVVNTTTEFKVKIFIAILLTFATDFHKGVYEKYAEGADAWQMLKAGLDAMVIIIIARLFHFLVRQLITVILAVTHVLRAHSRGTRRGTTSIRLKVVGECGAGGDGAGECAVCGARAADAAVGVAFCVFY